MTNKPNPPLRLVHSATSDELRRRQALDAITNRPFISGTWEDVVKRRQGFLTRDYAPPDIPPTDVEGRMERLKQDLLEAIRSESLLRAKDFPHDEVELSRVHIGLANVVDAFVEHEGEGARLAEENRQRHFRTLVETLLSRAVLRCTRETADHWLYEHKKSRAENPDLTWLAVSEINAGLIGTALPRALVLPNFYKTYNPFFIFMEEGCEVYPETAAFMRLLFSY